MTERAGRGVVARLAILIAFILVVAACTADATPSDSPVAVLTPVPTASSAAPAGSAAPSTAPKPTAKPTPAAGWTDPVLITSEECGSLRGGIDAAGGSHAVAACGTHLLYASANADGSWARTAFDVPSNRVEQDPQLAFQGKLAYFAYSRLATTEGGCGDDGLRDIGVFYRKRTLPSGAWSNPVRIGRTDDHLAQFRVDGTTFHAIVRNEGDGRYYYLLVQGATSHRYRLPALHSLSLRVGNDGRARIAYSSAGILRIATFTGSGFSTVKVSTINARYPVLILDSRDRAHVVWSRDSHVAGFGCADTGSDDPSAGMYYATNASGTWRAERLTREVGQASFQVDRSTGQVHLVISTASALTYYTKNAGGTWQHEALAPKHAISPVLARDAPSGRILILYLDWFEGTSGIYAISKGG
jgi:hypothetical protein